MIDGVEAATEIGGDVLRGDWDKVWEKTKEKAVGFVNSNTAGFREAVDFGWKLYNNPEQTLKDAANDFEKFANGCNCYFYTFSVFSRFFSYHPRGIFAIVP